MSDTPNTPDNTVNAPASTSESASSSASTSVASAATSKSEVSESASKSDSTAPVKAARGVTLTDSTIRRLKQLDAQRGISTGGLRLAVRGGGCSGLTYVMDWVEKPREKDKVFERDGGRVYVDSKSLLYLGGTVVDYEESLMASGFRLKNPNVKGSCGCGESFSV
jgi:iron-sulfur cluster assembly protein